MSQSPQEERTTKLQTYPMTNIEGPLFATTARDPGLRPKESLALCLLVSLLIGLLYTILFMGPRVLNPRDIGWLTHDPVAHSSVGTFRHDPQWHWPLTFTTWLGYPVGESAALQDFNPVWPGSEAIFSNAARALSVFRHRDRAVLCLAILFRLEIVPAAGRCEHRRHFGGGRIFLSLRP